MFGGYSTTYCCKADRRGCGYCVRIHDKKTLDRSFRKLVVEGKLFNCVQEGDKKVVKFHLSRTTSSKQTCKTVLEKCRELRRMVNMFPKHCNKVLRIKVISPDMVCMDKSSCWLEEEIGRKWDDEWVTVEQCLEPRFRMLVDSQGHVTNQRINVDVLEELIHLSYVESNGEMVVCGLQGVYDGDNFYLSEPTFHSMSRRYGDSDGGKAGIANVFKNHRCTDICRQWPRPPRETDVPDIRLPPTAPPLTATHPKHQLTLPKVQQYQDTMKYICDNQNNVLESQIEMLLIRSYKGGSNHRSWIYDDPPPPYTEY